MTEIYRLPIFRLRLRDGVVASSAGTPEELAAVGRDFGGVLGDLLERFAGGLIIWYEERLESILSDPDDWVDLPRHPHELLHLGFRLTPPEILRSLQSAARENPFVLPSDGVPRRLTWLISAGAGISTVAALRLAGGLNRAYSSLPARWADLGLRGFRQGLFAYHDDRLLREPPRAAVLDRWQAKDLGKLVRRHWGRKAHWALRDQRWFQRRRGAIHAPGSFSPSGKGAASHLAGAGGRTAAQLAPTVDVVIPTLDRRRLLIDVLDDLAVQTLRPQRVVVVEQRPAQYTDDLGRELKERGDPFELVYLRTEMVGASRARNLGIARTRAHYVALLDDDVRLPRNLLARMVAELRRYGAAAVNAGALAPDEVPRLHPGPARPSAGVGSGRTIIEHSALARVGGFDERIEGWGEDFELGLRLHLHGYTVVESERCHLIHLKAGSGGLRSSRRRRDLEPWTSDLLRPKPSPLITYRWKRWMTPGMLRGATIHYLLSSVRRHRLFPFSIALLPMIWLRWRRSLAWADKLLEAGPALREPAETP
ncbi:MAG: glycosyltransferase [bacterium]|nr:glycosyltransferase [bacterium]